MHKISPILLLLFLFAVNGFAQKTWISAGASNWNNGANWSPAGVPGPADVVTFSATGLGNCTLDIAPTVAGITVNGYTGTINLNGFDLTTTGNNTFTTGTINNGGASGSLTLNTTGSTTFNGTTFGANVNGTTGRVFFNGSTFNGSMTLSKTDNNNDNSSGNNVFNGTTTLTNLGAGWLLLGNTNRDQFNGNTIFNNNGSFRFYFAHNHGGQTTTFTNLTLNSNKSGGLDVFSFFGAEGANTRYSISGTLTINCAGTLQSNHRFLQGAGSTASYTGPVVINVTNTNAATDIQMGTNGTSTYGGNISITNSGGAEVYFNLNGSSSSTLGAGATVSVSSFASGLLSLPRFTQTGGTAQTLALSGTAALTLGPATVFGGNADLRAPQLFLNGVTFAGSAYLEKNGATDNTGSGNNVFNSTATIVNSGSGFLRTNGNNTFNSVTTLTNSGSNDVLLDFVSGSTYNGNVILNNSGTSRIRMAYAGTNLFNGNIEVNSTAGTGIFFNELGTAISTLAAGRIIAVGPSGFSTGTLNLPRFTQTGGTSQTLALTGTSMLIVGPGSAWAGNVNFSAPRILLNGAMYSGAGTFEKTGAFDDFSAGGNTFGGITTINNSGSGEIFMGNGAADTFNGITTFNNTGSFRIRIAWSHAGQTTTFANTLTLNSNKTGGVDQWSFLLGENTNTHLFFGGDVVINCGGSIRSDHRFLAGTGSSAVFNGTLTINNTNTSAATAITMGVSGVSTYNGNISVVNSGGAAGVTFNSNPSASSTLNGVITTGAFPSGSLNLFRFTQVGVLPENITLTGTALLRVGPASSFQGNVTFVAPRLFLDGATYSGSAYLEKSGPSNDDGAGGNVFQGATTLVASSSGYLLTANANPDIFNGPLTVTNSGSNFIYLAHNVAGNQFNDDITLNNTGSAQGILFSNNATGASSFTGGALIVGGSGFTTGDLRLRRFSQSGGVAQTLTLTGTARLWIGPNSSFADNVTFVAPQLLLNGAIYNGVTYLEKSGPSPSGANDGTGGNIFNQLTTIVNSGSAYLLSGAAAPDIFNSDLVVTNSGSSTIRLADNSPGTQFNGDVELNSTFGGGIFFGNNAAGTSTLASGRTIGVGSSGVISGDIRLIRFTQLGPTAQTLDLTGIATLTLGPSSTFNGPVDFRAPQVLLNGTIYQGTTYLEKKGAGDNAGTGSNVFNGAATLVNSGSGFLVSANVSPDIFNSTLTVTNTGSNIIYLAHNAAGNQFNGNISFNSTLGSGGIRISDAAGGTSTLGTGASLLVGGLGFSSGELRFRRLTQVGSAPQTLLLTGTALLRVGPTTTFNGNLDFRAPRFALDGGVYNGTTYLEKTGAVDDDSNGGNTFNGPTTIANSGAGFFRLALSSLDTFNGDLTLTNTGSASIRMADNVPGTVFNGNIIVNSTAGGGIFFSESGGGTATLAAGRAISVGGLGFSIGELRIRRLTQLGSTAQNLTLTGTAGLLLGPTVAFNGPVDFRAPRLFINSGTYNNTTNLEKTGATDNEGLGGAVFGGATTITNSGSGYLRNSSGSTFNGPTNLICSGTNYLLLELFSGSTYNGNLTLTNTGTSNVRVAYAGNNFFNGNIEVNSTAGLGVYFNEVTSTSTLATGRTISVGGIGFTAGELRIQRFTQLGSTAQSIALTGTTLRSGPSVVWNGNVTFSAPLVLLDGSTFNGATNSLTGTGPATAVSFGGNVFGGNTTIAQTGTGIFRLANSSADDFTGNVTFDRVSGTIEPAFNVASTFRGDVTVNGSTAITFGANTGGITFAGGNAQNVIRAGSASPVFRRLVMNKSANSVSLQTDVSVTVSATFTSGVLNTTTTNVLNFASGSTVVGGSNASHVDGPVVKIGNTPFSFPTGDGGFYRAISISAPTTATHAFRAEYFKAAQAFGGPATYPSGILTVSSCEYWLLDRIVGASNVSVTLSWNSPECVGPYITDITDLRVMRWNGAAWVNQGNGGTTGSSTAGTVISSGPVTAFSPFTLGSTTLDNPLPIELTSFVALTDEDRVQLKWSTASELNNDFFAVERSSTGEVFQELFRVTGAGTTNLARSYEAFDEAPLAGPSFYRLRQTDFDGSIAYSNVVRVEMDADSFWAITPNPSDGELLELTFARQPEQHLAIEVRDLKGVTVLRSVGNFNSSRIELKPSERLASGVYVVTVSTQDGVRHKRWVIR